MITHYISNGIKKILVNNKYKNRSICRIYSLDTFVPERVIEEEMPGSGVFHDPENGKRFMIRGEMLATC